MPKKKKQNKKEDIKEESEEKEKEKELEEKPKESELESEIEETQEELQERQISNFIPIQGQVSAPVLEKIADAPEVPDIDWNLSPQREEEKEKTEQQDYQFLEQKTEQKEYAVAEPMAAPVLRAERVDFSSIGRERPSFGREFNLQGSEEFQRTDEYEPENIQRGFDPTRKVEREKPGREYKIKNQ